jgi:hypothetical protein
MLPISALEATELTQDEDDSLLTLVQGFAVGSGPWQRERTTSSPSGPPTKDIVQGIPFSVARTKDVTFALSVTGETVTEEGFTWVAPGDYPIRQRDVMVNEADPRLKFLINSSRYTGSMRTGEADQQ